MTEQQQILFSTREPSPSPEVSGGMVGTNQVEEIRAIAAHPVFELGNALFKGDTEGRAGKLLVLTRIIDAVGTAVAIDGTIREMTLPEIQYLVPELLPEEVFDLVRRMSQDELLLCEGKYYQVAPLAAVLIQIINFISRMQDESGSSAAVISSVFSYQLEVGSQSKETEDQGRSYDAIKAVIRDIGRFNAHLEDIIRNSVLADLDGIVKDLNAINFFCDILDSLVGKMSPGNQPGDVFWLERARRVIRRLRILIDALEKNYSMRISKSLAGSGRYVTDDVLEKWMVHALAEEKGTLTKWIQEFDHPAYISIFPSWLLLEIAEDGPPVHMEGDDPDKIIFTSAVVIDEAQSSGSSEENRVTQIINDLIKGMVERKGESMRASDLVDPQDWESTAIRLCYLGTAISLLERDYLEKWAVDGLPEIVRFDPSAQVASISEAEIGEWTYLTQKKTEQNEL